MGLGLQNDFAEEGLFHNKTSSSQRGAFGSEIISEGGFFRRGAILAAKLSQTNEFACF